MALTSVTALAALQSYAAYIKTKFRERAVKKLVMDQFGDDEPIPSNFSKTIRFPRYAKLGKITANLDEAIYGGWVASQPADNPAPSQLVQYYIDATLETFGDYVVLTENDLLIAIDKVMDNASGLLSDQYKESIDWRIMKNVVPYVSHLRVDADATNYEKLGFTASSDGAAGGTTIVDTALTEADDFWNGAYVTIKSGNNTDVTRQVTDFVASTDTLTVNAFPYQVLSGTVYDIVSGEATLATETLTLEGGVQRAVSYLQDLSCMPYEDNFFRGILDPFTQKDLFADDDFKSLFIYTDPGPLKKGYAGDAFGVKFYWTNQPYREDDEGVQSDTGIVHNNLFLGQHCYGFSRISGDEGKAPAALRFYINRPGSQTLSEPFRQIVAQLVWKARFITQVKNASWGLSMMTGASA